jgi:putative ABC transport system permease protein
MTMQHLLSLIAGIRGRFRALFDRRAMEDQFSDEIRLHLELETEQNIRRGMSPAEARRAARLAFGGVEVMREHHRDARGTRRFEDLLTDARYAIRALGRQKGFTTAIALTMMLGIGANAAVFSVAYGVLLRPLPYQDAGQLVRLWSRNDSRQLEFFSVSPADYAVWRERNRVFSAIGAFERQRSATLLRGDEPASVEVSAISPDIFALLGTPAALGRRIVESDIAPGASPVALISWELWTTQFGSDSSLVGREIIIDGAKATVIGVMPERFFIPGSPAPIWTPMPPNTNPDHGFRSLRVLGRLRPGVTIEQARTEMDAIAAQIGVDFPRSNRDWRVSMLSIPETVVGRGWRKAVIVLTGVVGFVLLIACANAANLQLARGAARQRELAMRTALGARRGRVVAQLLTESTVLAIIGGALGLALAYAGVSVLRTAGAESIPRLDQVEINGLVLAFTLAVTVASGFLFGILPALGGSHVDVATVLKEGGRSVGQGRVSHRMRGALVITQVALSLILLIGAGLLMRSFIGLQRVQIGFDPSDVHVANVRLPAARYSEISRVEQFYATVLERVRQTPGVRSAAVVSSAPFAGPNTGYGFIIPERPPQPGEPAPDADIRVVSDGYFRTMGIDLLRGRDFAGVGGREAGPTAVISQVTARKYWPNEDPMGRTFDMWFGQDATRFTIIGIVGDARYFGIETPEVRPMIYLFWHDRPQHAMSIVTSIADAAALPGRLRQVVREADREVPLGRVDAMERLVWQAMATQRFAVVLFAIFAATALGLAAIGIYGVLAYLVRQRTHEMGIRVALGASSRMLMSEVLAGAMRLTVPGVIIGVAGAWWLSRLIANLLFGVSPTDRVTFLAVVALLTVTAMIASLIPARRATKADPMLALRGE